MLYLNSDVAGQIDRYMNPGGLAIRYVRQS